MIGSKIIECVLCLSLLANEASAIDLSDKAFKPFPKIKDIAGLHKFEDKTSSPPSTTIHKWYINMVDSSRNDLPKDMEDIDGCASDAQVCGLTYIKLSSDGDKKSLTESFSFSNSIKPRIRESHHHDLSIKLDDAKWGDREIDASIHLICAAEDDEKMDGSFDLKKLRINWRNNAFCKKGEKPKAPPGKDGKKGDDHRKHGEHHGFGLFTWIIILLVMAYLGYAVITALSRSRNEGSEFLVELRTVLDDTVGKTFDFFKQIVAKVTGSGDRGGYSAV